jgi:hypothetical protein
MNGESRNAPLTPLTLAEFDELLAAKVRAGDVNAMELWWGLYGEQMRAGRKKARVRLKLIEGLSESSVE